MDVHYRLTWFEKDGDAFVGEKFLEGVYESEVRQMFKLNPNQSHCDCYLVTEDHQAWLKSKGVHIQPEKFVYFVEATAPEDSSGCMHEVIRP